MSAVPLFWVLVVQNGRNWRIATWFRIGWVSKSNICVYDLIWFFFFLKLPISKEGIRDHNMVAWGGRLFVHGGVIGNEINKKIFQYDIGKNQWSTLTIFGSSPPPRKYATAVRFGSSMFIFGGLEETPRGERRLNDLWELNFLTRTWKLWDSHPAPWPRSKHGAGVWQGQLIIVGGTSCTDGCDVAKTQTKDIWKIQLERNPWLTGFWNLITASPILPGEAINNVAIVGDDIYVLDKIENLNLFNMEFDNWKVIPKSAKAVGMEDTNMVNFRSNLVVIGALQKNMTVQMFNTASKEWSALAPVVGPSRRRGYSSVIDGNSTYVFGGKNGFNELYRIQFTSGAIRLLSNYLFFTLTTLFIVNQLWIFPTKHVLLN